MDEYRIEWVPASIVEAAAERLGRRYGDGTSIWDWLEADNYAASVTRKSFTGAIRAARNRIKLDAFGEVRIYRQVELMQPWGRAEVEDRERWDVQAGGPDPTKCDPDHVYSDED